MPLLNGSTDEILNENIAELRRSGYPEDQAVAVAMKKQRESKKTEDEAAPPDSPLAAAAKKAKAVREGKTSAADAASGPSVLSDNVAETMAGAAPKPKVAENDPGKPAPTKKAKPIPKFKTRGAQSHQTRVK